jgi:hypothetical protein
MTPEEALGPDRVVGLRRAHEWLVSQRAFTDDAETTAVTLKPLRGEDALAWLRREQLRGADWSFVKAADGTILAIDEPSAEAGQDPAGAVNYPELHTRLVAWWLVHAWRAVDLIEGAHRDLQEWRVSTAAVSARAALEETGCLLYELRALDEAWADTKTEVATLRPEQRASYVRQALAPALTKATFGSRMRFTSESLSATNVLTYIQKLAKAVGRPEVIDWYDWLSDAAHPAAGARIALASQPVVHDTGAVMLQFLARRPVPLTSGDGQVRGTDFSVAHRAADAVALCSDVASHLLSHGLWLVDDFGLTTAAATLTQRSYWRALKPVKGSRPCPCGRGSSSACAHRWGADRRTLQLDMGQPPGTQPPTP